MIWTPANQLTVLRMVFVPVIVLAVVYRHFGWALSIFLIAGITDGLDGLIARRFHQQTTLGALLDPIADKMLLISAFVVLSLPSLNLSTTIPLWLTITTLSRDLIIVISCVIIHLATGDNQFPPSLFGKATTVVQLVTILAALLGNYLEIHTPYFSVVVYLTLFFTVLSGLHYFYRATKRRGLYTRNGDKSGESGLGLKNIERR
ncbi:MAG: CDP-alcohol phosphatidyltransferase family protein [Acidobacteria bacterium]|nr:CDP-alcohol phosphatidyltransferase family protein [Acidobacteriota bacterium]MBI3658446.1 CDP-alcohol phosphatidyltransferase family protein [Acidobacteriota bacterium]